MDIFQRLFEWGIDLLYSVGSVHIHFLIRAVLVIGIPTVACWHFFDSGNRSLLGQWFVFLISFLTAVSLKIDHWRFPPHIRMWVVSICLLLLVFLPAMLPYFLFRIRAHQNRARIVLYMVLILLFVFNL